MKNEYHRDYDHTTHEPDERYDITVSVEAMDFEGINVEPPETHEEMEQFMEVLEYTINETVWETIMRTAWREYLTLLEQTK